MEVSRSFSASLITSRFLRLEHRRRPPPTHFYAEFPKRRDARRLLRSFSLRPTRNGGCSQDSILRCVPRAGWRTSADPTNRPSSPIPCLNASTSAKSGKAPSRRISSKSRSTRTRSSSSRNLTPRKRKETGLQAVFKEVFPIESYDGKVDARFRSYEIGEPKIDWLECMREGQTYRRAALRDLPAQGGEGHQGGEGVHGRNSAHDAAGHVRHQRRRARRRQPVAPLARHLLRVHDPSRTARCFYSFRIIPDRGSWLEVQFDTNDLLYVYLDRQKRRRKFLATTFFRALGYRVGRGRSIKLFYTDRGS